MGIEIRPITFETVMKSQMMRMAYRMMVNDSVVADSMQEEGLKLLATNDTGFEKGDEIQGLRNVRKFSAKFSILYSKGVSGTNLDRSKQRPF